MTRDYRQHLRSKADLETSYEAVCAGFVSLALEKNRRASPYVAQARALKEAASRAKLPRDLLKIPDIQPALLTAAGLSDKAISHLEKPDKVDAISVLIKNFLEPAGAAFVEELVFRFLLTKGDSLGGSMRNIGGFMAQRKLTRSIISHLKISGRSYQWMHSETSVWAPAPESDADIELYLRGLSWEIRKSHRTLVFNLTLPFKRNNVDLCLFDFPHSDFRKTILGAPERYLALGELKGGIDPAGADEHWKTARTALDRIQVAFKQLRHKPRLFFIGAAIESKMASEIWKLLQRGILDNAANLTDDNQISSITRWLCSL